MMKKWKRNRILRRIDKLMDLTDIQLGRKVRKYFLHLNRKTFIIRNTLRIGIDFLIIMAPLLIGGWQLYNDPSFYAGTLVFAMLSSIPLVIFGMIELGISVTIMFYHLVIRRGPIGSIMDPIVDWSDKYSVDYCSHYVSFSDLVYMCLDPDGIDNINDWSDEELGRFMNLVLGCLVIHIKAGCGSNEDHALYQFLDGIHADSTTQKIADKVISRREKRTKREQELEESRLSDVAESMKDRIVQEEPDDSPEFRKIRDLKERLDEKSEDLRMAATSKIGPAS